MKPQNSEYLHSSGSAVLSYKQSYEEYQIQIIITSYVSQLDVFGTVLLIHKADSPETRLRYCKLSAWNRSNFFIHPAGMFTREL